MFLPFVALSVRMVSYLMVARWLPQLQASHLYIGVFKKKKIVFLLEREKSVLKTPSRLFLRYHWPELSHKTSPEPIPGKMK